mmetsp:Transcript_44055/g.116512  ORF Transcript_44055/g.116512 Transcript_44055/m.116512 type:complete len:335 (-) Transcript_44055:101-1105(-)
MVARRTVSDILTRRRTDWRRGGGNTTTHCGLCWIFTMKRRHDTAKILRRKFWFKRRFRNFPLSTCSSPWNMELDRALYVELCICLLQLARSRITTRQTSTGIQSRSSGVRSEHRKLSERTCGPIRGTGCASGQDLQASSWCIALHTNLAAESPNPLAVIWALHTASRSTQSFRLTVNARSCFGTTGFGPASSTFPRGRNLHDRANGTHPVCFDCLGHVCGGCLCGHSALARPGPHDPILAPLPKRVQCELALCHHGFALGTLKFGGNRRRPLLRVAEDSTSSTEANAACVHAINARHNLGEWRDWRETNWRSANLAPSSGRTALKTKTLSLTPR